MKCMKKLAAALLTLAMVLTMLPVSAAATTKSATTNITVTVEFNASTVADNLVALQKDMSAAGLLESGDTAMPGKVTVTVAKGTTVADVLVKAQKKAGFEMEGASSGYVTKVGFISNDNMAKLVSIPVGDYNSGNIFSMAGWSFAVNGTDLMEGISSAKVTTNQTVVTGNYHLVSAWSEEASSMIYYDTEFVTAYQTLKGQIARTVDLTSFSAEEKTAYETARTTAEAALTKAYQAGTVSGAGITSTEKGGLWIGLYETAGTALYGDTSVLAGMNGCVAAMKAALAPQDKLDQAIKASVKATKIIGLTANRKKNTVVLTWKKNGKADLTGYEVYRGTKKNGTYTKIATVKTAKMVMTKKATNKQTYYIKIRGFQTVNGQKIYTGFSTVKIVK